MKNFFLFFLLLLGCKTTYSVQDVNLKGQGCEKYAVERWHLNDSVFVERLTTKVANTEFINIDTITHLKNGDWLRQICGKNRLIFSDISFYKGDTISDYNSSTCKPYQYLIPSGIKIIEGDTFYRFRILPEQYSYFERYYYFDPRNGPTQVGENDLPCLVVH